MNARNLARHLRSMDALLAASEEELTAVEGMGPIMAATVHETLAEERTRELIERLREHGLQMEEEGPAPPERGPAGGQDRGADRDAADPDPARGHRSASRRRAARSRARCRRRPTTWWPARIRARSYTKAQELGTEILDEEAFRALVPEDIGELPPPPPRQRR